MAARGKRVKWWNSRPDQALLFPVSDGASFLWTLAAWRAEPRSPITQLIEAHALRPAAAGRTKS